MPQKLDDRIQNSYDDRLNSTANTLHSAEQDAYDKAFNGMTSDDNYSKDADPAVENIAINRLNNREKESSGGWETNLNSFADKKGFNKPKSKINTFVKKGGPIGGIAGLLLGGAGLLSFFGGPGLLVVNFVEQYTNAFNTQLASMDARMSRIVRAKLDNTTKGAGCKLPGSVLCKYSTFSQKELDNFEKNKVTPVDVKRTVTGRYKISGFKLESGETVRAGDFAKRMKSDIDFRDNITKSYGGIGSSRLARAGLWDAVGNKWKAKWGINFARPFKEGSTNDERRKVVDDLSKGKEQTALDTTNRCSGNNSCTEEERKAAAAESEANAQANEKLNSASSVSTETESATSKLGKGAGGAGTVFKGFGLLGAADSACAFLGFARNVGLVTKTTQLKQMLLFSTIFLTTHSMIKSGDANDQDVSFVGDMLTQTFTTENGGTTKAATDSFGYRNAAYGDAGIDKNASPYIMGASFGGESSSVMSDVIALLGAGGTAASSIVAIRETCKFVNNPAVVAGSIIAGIGALFIPGANVVKLGTQLTATAAFIAAQDILLAKIGDISKGVLVGKNDSREAVGNIMNVSTSSMLMGVGNNGGNPILTKSQTQSVLAHYNETKLAYAEMDRRGRSPFDATSENTFVGSIYSKFMPYIAKSHSLGGAMASLMSLNKSISSNILGQYVSAAESTKSCQDQDPDIKDAGYATTEFCVPWTGTDPKYLDIDPIDAAQYLVDQGYLNGDTDEFTDKAKPFIESCITRDQEANPYGFSGENFDQENGKGCLIDDSKVSYFANPGEIKVQLSAKSGELESVTNDEKVALYIHTQDMRNNDILENGLPDPIPPSAPNGQTTDESGGTGVSGTDQELAKKIVDNKNILTDPKYASQFVQYSKGNFSCKISSDILKLVASLGEKHSLYITSLNRFCTNTLTASGVNSLHYASGGGSAVDIGIIDKVPSSGGQSTDIAVYNEALRILPNKKLQLGQINCRPASAVNIPAGNSSTQVDDSCDHVHIGVYP